MAANDRHLQDLFSVGPAMVRDFELLGIRTVEQLALEESERVYEEICRLTGQNRDICRLDVFSAAVAQARHPHLPPEQRQGWYGSRKRKGAKTGMGSIGRRWADL